MVVVLIVFEFGIGVELGLLVLLLFELHVRGGDGIGGESAGGAKLLLLAVVTKAA